MQKVSIYFFEGKIAGHIQVALQSNNLINFSECSSVFKNFDEPFFSGIIESKYLAKQNKNEALIPQEHFKNPKKVEITEMNLESKEISSLFRRQFLSSLFPGNPYEEKFWSDIEKDYSPGTLFNIKLKLKSLFISTQAFNREFTSEQSKEQDLQGK